MVMIAIWVKSIDANIIVISVTWLTKSVIDDDRAKKGGGMAC